MLRIQLSKPKSDTIKNPRSEADRYAIRYGLITAVIIVLYNFFILASGKQGFEIAHLAIFPMLFVMVGYGMNKARSWIRDDHAMDDRMLFGLVMSIATALGVIAINTLLAIFNYNLMVDSTVYPLTNRYMFAVNAMGIFWGCLIAGGLSTFIFAQFYNKD